jgi:hypothetical protein
MFGGKTMVQGHQIYRDFPFESSVKPVALQDVSIIGMYLKNYTQRNATG